MNERRQGLLTSVGLLILRVGIGAYLMTHGWQKVMQAFEGRFAEFSDPIGLGKPASLLGAAAAEYFCALLVALGLLTRLAAIPIAFTMGIAAFVIHRSDPYTLVVATQAGSIAAKELALVFLFPMVALIFTGPGWFSLDALVYPYLSRRRTRSREQREQRTGEHSHESAAASQP